MAYELDQTLLEKGIQNTLDKSFVQGAAVTISATGTPAQLTTGWDDAVDGVLSTAATTGAITAGQAGTAILTIGGSFSNTGGSATVITIDLYKNGVTMGYPITRTVAGSEFGSFFARAVGTCVATDVFTAFISVTVDKALTFDGVTLGLEWQA